MVNQLVNYSMSRNLNNVMLAIADPTRRAILQRLTRGPARISDLAQPFPMSLPGFCKHVRVLERAGLVRRTRHGRENTLAFAAEPLRDAAKWIFKFESFWNERLDRLENYFIAKKENPQ